VALRIHYFQHVPYEPPARIGAWAQGRGHALTGTHLYAGQPPPPPESFDWLVVMGGPMSVHDERAHPWLAAEKRALEGALAAGKTVVGVCLGAQLLAGVLGARVYRNREKEIGWFDVRATEAARAVAPLAALPARLTAFHWHGDTFDLPRGAVHAAASEACAQQVFAWDGGRVVGIQFHLEMTREGVSALIENGASDLAPGPWVQSPGEMLAQGVPFDECHCVLDAVLSRLPQSAGGEP
jgi:GMP synthase-like glutamine amidotransferase